MLLLFVLDSCVFFFLWSKCAGGMCMCVCMHATRPCCKNRLMCRDNRAVNMQDVWFCRCLNLGCGQFVSFMLNGYYFHLFDSRI